MTKIIIRKRGIKIRKGKREEKIAKRAKYYYSPVKRKILILLLSGIAFGLSQSPTRQWKILKNLPKAWKEIEREKLRRYTKEFYEERLLDYNENADGLISLVLTKEGKRVALCSKLDELEIRRPLMWDENWRVITYDIPEKKKLIRDAFREKLKRLGLLELQRSVFIYPYHCEDEIDFVVEVFDIRSCVHVMTVKKITNESELKLKFDLH